MDTGTIIWQQISNDTKMTCGARQTVTSDEGLHFTVTITRNQFNKIEVTLDRTMDLYNVKLWKINRKSYQTEIIKETPVVYAEDLSETIYAMCNK